MANLPTSLSIQQPNISDGSDLLRMAAMLSKGVSDTADKAFTDFKSTMRTSANNDLAATFANGIASGLSPDEAFKQASGTINSWTSADAINAALQTRNAEKEAIIRDNMDRRAEAQENRLQLDWEGANKAAEANNLFNLAHATNNMNLFKQAEALTQGYDDITKKHVKPTEMATLQDSLANSAVSRAYTRALKDNLEDKKLASKLDAEFRVIKSQNPLATNAQVAQAVAKKYNLTPDNVNLILNEYGLASGQSLLDEASSNLSHTTSQDAINNYTQAQKDLQDYEVNIQKAITGDTEQNKKDTNTAIDILSKDLSSVLDEEGDPALRASLASVGMPATTKLNEKEAKEIVSSLIKNPSKKNFESIKNKLETKGYHGHFVDWLNSNFIINKSNQVELSPNTSTNINNALNQELIGDVTRKDLLAKAIVDSDRYALGFNKLNQKETYSNLLSLARKKTLTDDERQQLNLLNVALNQNSIDIGKQEARVAQAAKERFPLESTTQTLNTFGDLVDSGKKITTGDLVSKGFTESEAENILDRIEDVKEEAQDSKEYKNIPLEAIIYAVLDKANKADSWLFSDKDYLKLAEQLVDKLSSINQESVLLNKAKAATAVSRQVNANKYVSGL